MIQVISKPAEKALITPQNRDIKLEIGLHQFNNQINTPVISEPQSVKSILQKMGLLN